MAKELEQRRLLWQSRRGALELDLLFRDYASLKYPHLVPALQQQFRRLLQEDDPQLMDWFVYKVAAPHYYRQLIADILAYKQQQS